MSMILTVFLYARKLRCNYLAYKKRSAKDAHLAEMKLVVSDTARARKSPVNGLFVLQKFSQNIMLKGANNWENKGVTVSYHFY